MPGDRPALTEQRIQYLERLVTTARGAAAAFSTFTQSDVDQIVKAMAIAGMEHAQELGRLACEETRIGVPEDKAVKNMVATEFVYNYIRDKRTVGVIRHIAETGITELAEPIGVVLSLVPITNPTATVLFKCIMAVKTRNSFIFCPHPRAERCSRAAVDLMYDVAVRNGAPEGVFGCLQSPTLQDNDWLMRHRDVRLIDATGGRNMVQAAYSSGKPALGVGPGNTPVYLEKSAHLEMAVVDILTSKTFDNGTICASEQTVVIDDEIWEAALTKFQEMGAHLCNPQESAILEQMLIDPETGMARAMAVGQKAADIAGFLGLKIAPETKLLIVSISGVGRKFPLSAEKLFPVLSIYRAGSTEEALDVCAEVNRYGGLGHTAVIFSQRDDIITRFGERMNAGRIIVNSPGSIGAIGGVYNDMVPTLSFGCGTGGGNSTTDNVNVYHYLNIKRMARRTQTHMWFRVPNQIYFNRNAVENLMQFPSASTVVVSNAFLEKTGAVEIVRQSLPPGTPVHTLTIPDTEPELKTCLEGAASLEVYGADQIVALGGGSVIDAAKIMKLKYECLQADIAELGAPFLDIRKRVVRYPTERARQARLIAIPTTSGTGSEITPFAVLIDREQNRKITLADPSLTPDVAVVDPQFVMSMPKNLTADTGIDALTHALEAAVSVYSSPYTDANALQAVRLVFEYLPTAWEQPDNEEARSMMHNAATLAAMAFANASVGINHALAHAIGARFGIAHGRANALLLPHVIAYNASTPTKFMPSPHVRGYTAPARYATIAASIGLKGGAGDLISAVEGLLDKLEIPKSIAAMGISKDDFEAAIPELVKAAFDDPSWRPTNPRMPLAAELVDLLRAAYEGRGSARSATASAYANASFA